MSNGRTLHIEKLDRESPIPLYLQIRQQLVALIADWPNPEERFPTDEELVERFDVAKATVRQAIAELTRAGLLTRKRGTGTFVMPPLVEKLRPNEDIEEQYQLAGGAVVHRVHRFVTRAPSVTEAKVLGIELSDEVLSLRRVRSVAHVPIAIDDRVMSVEIANKLNFTQSTAEQSIIDLVRRMLTLSRATWDLKARLAGPKDAALLQISPADPILVRSLTYFQDHDLPILTGETRHRSDILRCGFEMNISNSSQDDNVKSWTNEALLSVVQSS
jgi:GntR family transcriptional regulator